MSFTTDKIRNLVLCGHGGAGKTTLLERMLFVGGAISKPENIDSGKTVSDYTDEEIEHKISIHASLSHIVWNDKKINFIDTPGSSDFVSGVIAGIKACESALMVLDGRAGVQIETIKLWRNLDASNRPRAAFVSKLDDEKADFDKCVADIHDKFKVNSVAVTLPMGKGANLKGIIEVLTGKAYDIGADGKESIVAIPPEFSKALEDAKSKICEAAAEGDDILMEKYLESGSLSDEEILKGLAESYAEGRFVPVFAGSGIKCVGISALLNFVDALAPSPLALKETVTNSDGTEAEITPDSSKPIAAFVIKTQMDQFSGKLSYIKILTGKLSSDIEFVNVRENKKEKISKLYTAQGKKLEDAKELCAGDIGIMSKIATAHTNDTFSTYDKPFSVSKLRLHQPVYSIAINAVNKKEEDKLSEMLVKAAEEDLTFNLHFNGETHESVISGMGEQHINIILEKIKKIQHIEYTMHVPRVAYRETITKKASAEHTHKKQTGGHGQYARVVLDLAPTERGKKYEFVNEVVGGAISKGFIPAVDKGVHEAMIHGVLAGYPVVDVRVAVTDGKEHPVDSSELAFKLASRGAFKDAMKNASAVLLEPVMHLTVFIENQYIGDVMSDISGRRGKIQGEQPIGGGIEELKALVPQSELLKYAIDLRSITSGTGSFEVEFDHYSPISGKIAEDVIKAAAVFHVEEAEE